jgi:hypothetical protein
MLAESWDIAEYLDRAFPSQPPYYIALGAFHWVASVSTLPLLSPGDDALRRWLDRGLDLYDGLGRDSRMKPLFE